MKVNGVSLGKVSLTCNGVWQPKEYDRLCIVSDGHYATYISKKKVPAGINLNNEEYWQPLSNLREDIQIDYNTFKSDILLGFADVQNKILSSRIVVEDDAEKEALTFEQIRVGCEVYVKDSKNTFILEAIEPETDRKFWRVTYYNSNSVYLDYKGTPKATRLSVPFEMRHKGLVINYNNGEEFISEFYNQEVCNDDLFAAGVNWSSSQNVIINGNVSIGGNGNWIVDGVDTGILARGLQGEKGAAPLLKVMDNKLYVSYDNIGWREISDEIIPIFRWQATNSNSLGKIQYSMNYGVSWEDLSPEFTNYMKIQGYVSNLNTLPREAPYGAIYGVGPEYEAGDTEHTNPKYRIYVKTDSGWIDNGLMSSLPVGITNERGNSDNLVMTQGYVTAQLEKIEKALWPLESSLTINNTLLEYTGNDQSLTITKLLKRNKETVSSDSITIFDLTRKYNNVVSSVDSTLTNNKTVNLNIKDYGTHEFKLTAEAFGMTSEAKESVTLELPIYIGFSDKTDVSSLNITSLNKQSIKLSPSGNYSINNSTNGYHLWICVPSRMSVNKVTSGGFEFPILASVTKTTSLGNYKCYRSASSSGINSGKLNITIS